MNARIENFIVAIVTFWEDKIVGLCQSLQSTP